MLITLWIITGVFGLISSTLLVKFFRSSINALETAIFIFSVVVFALTAGMLYDSAIPSFVTVLNTK